MLITAALGPYDCFEFGFHLLDWSDQPRSLGLLLLLRYAACVPVCLAAVVVVHVQLRHGLRDKAHMQILGCGLMLVGAVCFTNPLLPRRARADGTDALRGRAFRPSRARRA